MENSQQQVLRILHLSDTHNMQEMIEEMFPLVDADIMIHTGDLTNKGTMEELCAVNEWFGRKKQSLAHIVVIAGNHDVHGNKGEINIKEVLTNATVLDHEIAHQVLADFGLKIYGSPWCHWKPARDPGGEGHLFHQIPEGMDVLMTHGPPRGIFDVASSGGGQWGSSPDLNEAIMRAKPRVHLFGHLHEQRGVWQRGPTGEFLGGVEYQAASDKPPFITKGPPARNWPCDLISCNAMSNHGGHEYSATGIAPPAHIAGPARMIIATRSCESDPWQFTVPTAAPSLKV